MIKGKYKCYIRTMFFAATLVLFAGAAQARLCFLPGGGKCIGDNVKLAKTCEGYNLTNPKPGCTGLNTDQSVCGWECNKCTNKTSGAKWKCSKRTCDHTMYNLSESDKKDETKGWICTTCMEGNTPFYHCEPKPCESGYATAFQSADDCGDGTAKAAGWSYAFKDYSEDLKCGKCTAKNGCASGYSKDITTCSGCKKLQTNGYYGDTPCGKCADYTVSGKTMYATIPSGCYLCNDVSSEVTSGKCYACASMGSGWDKNDPGSCYDKSEQTAADGDKCYKQGSTSQCNASTQVCYNKACCTRKGTKAKDVATCYTVANNDNCGGSYYTYACKSDEECVSGSCQPKTVSCSESTKPSASSSCGCGGTKTRTVTCNTSNGTWQTGGWGDCSKADCGGNETCVNGTCTKQSSCKKTVANCQTMDDLRSVCHTAAHGWTVTTSGCALINGVEVTCYNATCKPKNGATVCQEC